jgi:hypothetical protein
MLGLLMPLRSYGNSLNGGVTRKITYNLTNTGNQYIEEIYCNWSSRNSNTPLIGTTNGEGYKLISAQQEQGDNATAKITLTWEKADGTTFAEGTSNPIPATTYDEQTSYTELDIRQHPQFESTLSDDWDEDNNQFNSSSQWYGVTSYIVGSTVVTKTEYFGSQPPSNYQMVGKLDTPGGGYTGANKWLVIGSGRRKIGDNLYARETQYLYSDKGWDTTIYS